MSDAPTAAQPEPSRVTRLLSLVRKLIEYGWQLGATLRRNPGPLGGSDLTVILARITRGLLRAEVLEARIVRNAARLAVKRNHAHTPRQASPACPSQTDPAPPPGQHRLSRGDRAALLARLPMPEQIAAQARRQPIGAVIADICRDLGIMPTHPLWRELQRLIAEHGGSLARLVSDMVRDRYFWRSMLNWLDDPAWPGPPRQLPAASCTGPPP
jgi:hypothetical protein